MFRKESEYMQIKNINFNILKSINGISNKFNAGTVAFRYSPCILFIKQYKEMSTTQNIISTKMNLVAKAMLEK